MSDYQYTPEHWSQGDPVANYKAGQIVAVTVNDRAATRQAIITVLKKSGYTLVERSSWGAKPPRDALTPSNWDYSDVVIHHAGHSYSCAVNEQGAIEPMKKAQEYDMHGFYDIGYHYAVSCNGEIFEARDVRFVGSQVMGDNTGKLGIVLLENLAEAGEAWQQEYSRESLWEKLKGTLDIGRDAVAFDHEMPTKAQLDALTTLIKTLKEFFNLNALGGHREYQLLAPGHEGRACPGKYGMQVVTQMRSALGWPLHQSEMSNPSALLIMKVWLSSCCWIRSHRSTSGRFPRIGSFAFHSTDPSHSLLPGSGPCPCPSEMSK